MTRLRYLVHSESATGGPVVGPVLAASEVFTVAFEVPAGVFVDVFPEVRDSSGLQRSTFWRRLG